MKEFFLLYKTANNNYLPISQIYQNSLSSLFSLLFGDFRPWDNNFLYQKINLYNAHFIYHDFEKKILYIGFGDWLIDSELDEPSDEDFPNYVNKSKNCKMSVDNFIEFSKNWLAIKSALPAFAIIYQDDNDWVDCEGFDSQEEMELFVKNYQPKAIH